ncbi:MAG: hypothetical protein ACRD4E_15475, partial [Bryobacteraceae bacterium]
VNPGHLDSWSFWLTRRLVVMLLEGMPHALEGTSAIFKQVPAEYRSDFAAFEREAALASTTKAMTHTDSGIMKSNANAAELAITLKIVNVGKKFRLELSGDRGGHAVGLLGPAELQRVLQMVYDETIKAKWLNAQTKPASTDIEATVAKLVRH